MNIDILIISVVGSKHSTNKVTTWFSCLLLFIDKPKHLSDGVVLNPVYPFRLIPSLRQ